MCVTLGAGALRTFWLLAVLPFNACARAIVKGDAGREGDGGTESL